MPDLWFPFSFGSAVFRQAGIYCTRLSEDFIWQLHIAPPAQSEHCFCALTTLSVITVSAIIAVKVHDPEPQ